MVSHIFPDVLSLRGGQTTDTVADPRVDVHEDAFAAIQAERIRRHVEALPPREKQVIRARFGLDGPPQSHHVIARDLHMGVASVWKIEHRALARLRRIDDRATTVRVAA